MKLINHIIIADLRNGEKLLINSLNGLMDKIAAPVYESIITRTAQEACALRGDGDAA